MRLMLVYRQRGKDGAVGDYDVDGGDGACVITDFALLLAATVSPERPPARMRCKSGVRRCLQSRLSQFARCLWMQLVMPKRARNVSLEDNTAAGTCACAVAGAAATQNSLKLRN